MPSFRPLGIATILFTICMAPAWAQMGTPARNSGLPDDQTQIDKEMAQKNQLVRQKKRFEDMKRDSQKLLELATQLKQYVDRTGENTLSLEVMRKAEEMEKLARRVKENMRGE